MQKHIRGKPEHMSESNVLVDLCFWVKTRIRADIVSMLASESGPPTSRSSLPLSPPLSETWSLLSHTGL